MTCRERHTVGAAPSTFEWHVHFLRNLRQNFLLIRIDANVTSFRDYKPLKRLKFFFIREHPSKAGC